MYKFDFHLRKLFFLLFFFLGWSVFSQVPQEWAEFEHRRLEINRNGMLALSGWAALNLVSGSIGMFTASGEKKYFHQMNAFWNVINAGLGIAGYLQAVSADPANASVTGIMKDYQSMQNLFILNAGLDVAYIVTGLYLRERSLRATKNSDLLKGYGASVILQGTFLFVFDLTMFFLHKHHANMAFYPLINNEMTGVGMIMRF